MVNRRQFLRVTAGGAASVVVAGGVPATAQTRELTFLTIASFVPETDKELKRQFGGGGAKKQGQGRLDIIRHLSAWTHKGSGGPGPPGASLPTVYPIVMLRSNIVP